MNYIEQSIHTLELIKLHTFRTLRKGSMHNHNQQKVFWLSITQDIKSIEIKEGHIS